MDNPVASGWLLYDGDCALCVRLASRFSGLLERRRFMLLPLQAPGSRERLGLGEVGRWDEMKLLTAGGQLFGGADALVQIARRVWWAWPLAAISALPGGSRLLRTGYRWIARRRHCSDRACALRSGGGVAVWSAVLLPPAGAFCLREVLPAWGFMWALVVGIFLSCKWLTLSRARRQLPRLNLWRSMGYVFGWPGMDAGRFLREGVPVAKPSAREWCAAFGKTLLGAVLIWGLARTLPGRWSLAAGWVGWIGLGFLFHFGLFHLLSVLWRRAGVEADPIMRAPVSAHSVTEFWGGRWNAAFHDLAIDLAFRPLRRRVGSQVALMLVFLGSGLMHELVISVPARGGFGWPTIYFLVQGSAMLFERSRVGRRAGLGRGPLGRLFTALCTAGPAFWLFHPPFMHHVALPFLQVLGAWKGGTP